MNNILVLSILASLLFVADAHGRLGLPQPTFIAPLDDNTKYCGIINGYNALPGEKYDDSPQANTEAYTRAFRKSGYQSLKALVDAQGDTGGECGITRADGTPQPLPSDGNVRWIHGNEGFVASHEGPCEVWCDNTRVYQNDNCARNNPGGVMPIDVSKCQGASRLFFLWLAMHTHEWQVYKNCVPLQGGGGNRPPSPPSPPTPSNQPTMAPPPPSPPNNGAAQPWEQCGGEGYRGPTGCTQGFSCKGINQWYSQCVAGGGGATAETWGQCAGEGYSGPTNCKASDHCVWINQWYSQCKPY
ncbi:unnamed protein product [Aphanomyces euteiches]